ncbi:MAG: VanZ family protein [Clostridia bacterium]|nr:VanZ family protein [Clostridia bacterium]
MKDLSTKRKIVVSVIIILIALTVGFIWGNSVMSKEASSEESEAVSSTLQTVVDAVFGEDVLSVEDSAVRKGAHATEFALLGAEFCLLYIVLKRESKRGYLEIMPFGLAVAAIDETIQIFSDRGPSIIDVMIDYSGYLVAVVLFVAVFVIRRAVKVRKN